VELINDFEVGVPLDEAWVVLTDIERIAPCLPGAQLTEVEGDEYRGTVKVKLGAITAQYKGTARLVEKDDAAHRAVLDASGRDTRGAGNASATITAVLEAVGDGGTKVLLTTDLKVTGKVAQFGRGVMADVSAKLLGQFVENLETTVLAETNPEALDAEEIAAEDDAIAASGSPMVEPEIRVIEAPEATPVDLLDVAGGTVFRRVAPMALGLSVAVLVVWWWRRRR
jgi:carbon monoxide dehydrogenase subunit G